MEDQNMDDEARARLEDTQASIRNGIARARRMAAESKRLLDRLRYARLGPPRDPRPLLDPLRAGRD
ncbi:MAG TPA: hypothetical protein VIT45_05150 [Allosphingosinicella sp.]